MNEIEDSKDSNSLTSGIKQFGGNSNKKLWYFAGVIALVIIILLGWNISTQLKLQQVQTQLEKQKSDPQAEAKKQSQDLLGKVGQLIALPTDEEPTIATVSDLSKLENKPFFKNAQLGDKVIIYSKSRKAILYRPTDNKIIELAPLINDQESTPSAITSPATPTP